MATQLEKVSNIGGAVVPHGHEFRQSTDAAGLCGAIVQQTASNIQGRRYVSVEGWQAIAIAHGCAASARGVEKVEGGVRAIGEVHRMTDGQLIATGEGFVGEDEPTWYGGKNKWGKEQPKRPDYAIRAMAQTRAISRACRSAFAHVVVMIDAGLSTTPAEEVPEGGFIEGQFREGQVSQDGPANSTLREQLEQSVAEGAAAAEKPPRNWGGRYPTKTALRKARTEHHAEIERLGLEGTFDDLEGYMTSPEYQDYIKITGEHFPLWLEGEIPPEMAEAMPPEYIQTFALEQKARDMIAIRGNVPNVEEPA
jgi:hypothetical protein